MQNGFEKLGIGPDKPPKIILDFCWNHEGSIGRVRQMLEALQRQLYTTVGDRSLMDLVIPKFQAGRDLPWDRSMYRGVKKMCEQEFGLPFLCTAFDYKAVDMLVSIGVDAIKIGSAEAVDNDFFVYVRDTGKQVIVSTGGFYYHEVDRLHYLANEDTLILHCVSQYPAQAESLSLGTLSSMYQYNQMSDVEERFHGYSSHYPEVIDGVFAFALGAQVVEKHYSLTPGMQGDHLVSIGPHQAKILCEASLAWHKMRGHTKSEETLNAERELLKPFRERFYAGVRDHHQADQDQGQDEIPGSDA